MRYTRDASGSTKLSQRNCSYFVHITSNEPSSFLRNQSFLHIRHEIKEEKNVKRGIENEIHQVIVDRPNNDRSVVADAILNVLEDRYGNEKQWLVIIISEDEIKTRGRMERVLSGGFHTVNVDGIFAAVVSIDRDTIVDPVIRNKFHRRAENYHFPIETTD